ncbi:hypothetical protein SCG7109_AT_00070 [Chlamydiales bacterium SCGC AG-110-M15]|nr:hypothetical protein SCG7109_AT_00070 [Chlamydiales bacterium SCGC AG-110-M15]
MMHACGQSPFSRQPSAPEADNSGPVAAQAFVSADMMQPLQSPEAEAKALREQVANLQAESQACEERVAQLLGEVARVALENDDRNRAQGHHQIEGRVLRDPSRQSFGVRSCILAGKVSALKDAFEMTDFVISFPTIMCNFWIKLP